MGVKGFFQRHIGNQADYSPRRSLVNKVRDSGLSRPMVGAGVGAAVGAAAGVLMKAASGEDPPSAY